MINLKTDVLAPKNKSGFTLVEMLVVMAIFSLIASFVTSRIWGTRADARDVQRKRALSTLRSSASVFRDREGRWPKNLDELVDIDILPVLPTDPREEKTYGYATGTTQYDICFAACLEQSTNVSNPDVCSSTTFDKSYINNCSSSNLHYLTL